MLKYAYFKKTPVLLLALLMGCGNLAHAFAVPGCANMTMGPASQGMMLLSAAVGHACCGEAIPCECSIQVPSSERSMPERIQMEPLDAQLSIYQAVQHAHFVNDVKLSAFIPESPPRRYPALRSLLRLPRVALF